MLRSRLVAIGLAGAVGLSGLAGVAQDKRGRKYKAPPPTSHIEVTVTRQATGKPIPNAAVILRATRDGKDDGNLEVKTDPDGKASLDVITTGSKVLVQVIASGFATYADEFQVDEPSREIHIELLRPRAQVSAYEDNSGKAATRKPGIQEPLPPPKRPAVPTLQPRTTSPATAGDAPAKPDAGKTADDDDAAEKDVPADKSTPSQDPAPEKPQGTAPKL